MANEIDDVRILNELENLVRETFMLWDEKRVGFSWRHYFFNHTQRVRKLSVTIGKQEGADLKKLEYAALLHDITKRYDGDFLTDKEGKRVINEDGFWLNQMLMPNPNKSNIITQLFNESKLEYKIHNESGAIIAKLLLKKFGLPDDFCEKVASAISVHLKPIESSSEKMKNFMNELEGRIIYEADTMDSNLGLSAFFRNIGIHTYFMVQRNGKADLKEYIESIPKWVNMKDDFLPNMQTVTGRKVAEERQKRNRYICSLIDKEKENFEINETYGILGVIKYFMSFYEDPSLTEQMNSLDSEWIPERKKMLVNENSRKEIAEEGIKRAIEFNSLLRKEAEGEI